MWPRMDFLDLQQLDRWPNGCKLSDGESLMSIEHTVAKILSFEFHAFIEQKFLDPGLNSAELNTH